jgi:hypothetical protein
MKILLLDIDLEPIPSAPDYCISKEGMVVSLKPGSKRYGKPKKLRVSIDGYLKVKINKQYVPLHRLLAETFIPTINYRTKQVNHKDGNKLNNSLSNLEWVSQRENLHHAMDNGLHAWGRTKIRCSNGRVYNSQADAAKETGASQPNINKCLNGLRRTAGGLTWEYL